MRAARPALTEGPIAPTLLKFALPVLGTNVLQSLNGSVNSFWIGHYLGESALTASSNANLILFVLLLALVFGISMATSMLVGQTYGQQDLPRMKPVIGSGAVFFALLSVGVALLGHACTPMLLRWLATPAALPLASAYLEVIFLAVAFADLGQRWLGL